jgi:transposase-like protein
VTAVSCSRLALSPTERARPANRSLDRRYARSGKSIGKLALELGIGETALRRWLEQAEVEARRGPARALKRSQREELAELRRETQRLRLEREILAPTGKGGRRPAP